MKKLFQTRNPFILFFPFFIIYIILVLIYHQDQNIGDEYRYFMFAENILNGYYSPPLPCIDLGNGPGYSIFLIPFLVFHLPFIFISLTNAFLLYFSVILLFKVLLRFVSFNLAIIFSLFWATFYNSFPFLPLIISEIFTIFLFTLSIYSITRTFEKSSFSFTDPGLYFSGMLLGYLALTKPIFGYVIMVLIICSLFLLIIKRRCINYRKGAFLLTVAMITTMPYLVYTYQLTGRIFYWGSNGGNNLYWMTTPFENEYGSWFAFHKFEYDTVSSKAADLIPLGEIIIKDNHKLNHENFFKYCGAAQDDAYKKAAINNIREHPGKFMLNMFSNIGRMLFNYPYSYTLQKPGTLLRLPHNGIIAILLLVSLLPAIRNWRKIPFSIRFLFLTAIVYLGGSLLGSVEIRMFTIVVPILIVWNAFILQRTIKIKMSWTKSPQG